MPQYKASKTPCFKSPLLCLFSNHCYRPTSLQFSNFCFYLRQKFAHLLNSDQLHNSVRACTTNEAENLLDKETSFSCCYEMQVK